MPLNTESLVSRINDSLTHSNPGYLFCQPANKTMSVGGLGIIDVRLFSPFLHIRMCVLLRTPSAYARFEWV